MINDMNNMNNMNNMQNNMMNNMQNNMMNNMQNQNMQNNMMNNMQNQNMPNNIQFNNLMNNFNMNNINNMNLQNMNNINMNNINPMVLQFMYNFMLMMNPNINVNNPMNVNTNLMNFINSNPFFFQYFMMMQNNNCNNNMNNNNMNNNFNMVQGNQNQNTQKYGLFDKPNPTNNSKSFFICPEITGSRVNIMFVTGTGIKTMIIAPINLPVRDLLREYIKRMGLDIGVLGKYIYFLFNGLKININENKNIFQFGLNASNVIMVIDTSNLLGGNKL